MTITCKCIRCGKCFYIQGEDERLINEYNNAALHMRMAGYKAASGSVWRLVEGRAKCCPTPDISTISFGVSDDF